MEALLLAFLLFCCLLIIPLGLPGTWLMLGIAAVYSAMTHDSIGWITILLVGVLAVIAEVLEFMLGGRFARKYGGSKRAGWGAIVGGIVGAIVGVPVPLIGSMIGAFVGAFAGAFVFERIGGTGHGASTRVATGALLGRIAAAALKVGIGFVMAVWLVGSAVL